MLRPFTAAICVVIAFVACAAYVVVKHPFGIEEWHSTGAEARKWLDDVFAHEWTRCPFPPSSIIDIDGVQRGWDSRQYWLRVEFKPEFGEQIADALLTDLKKPGDDSITVRELRSLVERVTTEKPPRFWNLRELGDDAKSVEVLRLNLVASSGAREPARGVIVRLSKSRGIAYIRMWQL